MRLRWAFLVALAGGLLLAVSFPPVGIWPLAPLGVGVMSLPLSPDRVRTLIRAAEQHTKGEA